MTESKWILVDAKDISLGRVASFAANRLMGKDKADWTPYADNGDFVIIINSAKAKLTGKKTEDKEYHKRKIRYLRIHTYHYKNS